MAFSRQRSVPAGDLVRQTVLAVVAVLVVPLLFYPRQFGLPNFDLNPVFSLAEWALYFAVFALGRSRLPGSVRVLTAGYTVVCRLCLGVLLGSFLAWVHMKPWAPMVAEMMWSYPVALILQVLLLPLILRPVWERFFGTGVGMARSGGSGFQTGTTRAARTTRPIDRRRVARITPRSTGQYARPTPAVPRSEPSLDDAVSYVGEYDGVRLCWVVDAEGLPLAVWQRQSYSVDADYWAPISIEGVDYHRQRLSQNGDCLPKRLDVRTDQGRMIMESVGEVWLGVLTEPEVDDLISVRLSRACEMIANHLQVTRRKYSGAAEAHYV